MDPTGWPKDKIEGWLANVDRLEARRLRRALQTSGTRPSAKFLRSLVLSETGDPNEADRQAFEYLQAMMLAGQNPG